MCYHKFLPKTMKGIYCLMQDKYIAKREKGKHLTLAERAKIEVYLKEKILSKLKGEGAKFSDVLMKYHKLISNEDIDFFLYKYDHNFLRDTIDGIIEEAKSDLREDLEKDFSLEREDLERTIQEIDDLRDEISRLES